MTITIPINNTNGEWIPIANIVITDTNTHSYQTDPSYITLVRLGNMLGSSNNAIKTYSLWIYNGTDQTLTVQPIGNVVNDGSYPDFSVGSSVNVDASSTFSGFYPFSDYPVEYISTNLSFSTAPTNGGAVYVVLFIYYG